MRIKCHSVGAPNFTAMVGTYCLDTSAGNIYVNTTGLINGWMLLAQSTGNVVSSPIGGEYEVTNIVVDSATGKTRVYYDDGV